MKVILYSEIPTHHNYNALNNLTGYSKVYESMNGIHWSYLKFNTVKEAKEWLRNRFYEIYSDESVTTKRQMKNLHAKNWNWIEYDSTMLRIESGEEMNRILNRHV